MTIQGNGRYLKGMMFPSVNDVKPSGTEDTNARVKDANFAMKNVLPKSSMTPSENLGSRFVG